jgi:predicted enzyme related to lactoylglutathione lyase
MINAVHAVVYTTDAEGVRAFLRDKLGFRSVDAGEGWLIFALPPAELGVHPAKEAGYQLYLMCDDIESTIRELKEKGVEFSGPVQRVGWGLLTGIKLPGGGELGLYQPRHASPLNL